MKKLWQLATASGATAIGAAAMLAACATDGESTPASIDPPAPIPEPSEAGAQPIDGGDAGACTDDCEFFPDTCSEDALCFGGLFDPASPSNGLDLRTHVTGIAYRSASDAWLIGTVGAAAHFDGASWRPATVDTQHSLYALWLHPEGEVAFDDPRRLYTRGFDAGADADVSDGGWSYFGSATVTTAWTVSALRVATSWSFPGARSLWIGTSTSSSGSGGIWRLRHAADSGKFALTPIATDCSTIPCNQALAIHGPSPDELWAVGPTGAIFRITEAESDAPVFTGFNSLTTNALYGVWAHASNDVWAVGATGTVRRYRGDARFLEEYEAVPTTQHLHAVAGSSPSDVWIAGDEGTVFHFDGTSWTRVKVAGLNGRRPRLDRIWVPAPGKVWIAGQGVLVSLGGKP